MTYTIGVEDDCEDQGMTSLSYGCRRWGCIAFVDGQPVYRALKVRNGFWTCPNCGGSYGPAGKEET